MQKKIYIILHRLRDHIAQNYSTDRVEVPKAVVVDSVDSPALAGLATDYGSGSDDSEEDDVWTISILNFYI